MQQVHRDREKGTGHKEIYQRKRAVTMTTKKSMKERRDVRELIWIAGVDIVFNDCIGWKHPSVVLDPRIIDQLFISQIGTKA